VALFTADGGVTDHVFVDDAILIEKYYVVDMVLGEGYTPLSTISVSINANPRANEGQLNHWMNFDVDWYDVSPDLTPLLALCPLRTLNAACMICALYGHCWQAFDLQL